MNCCTVLIIIIRSLNRVLYSNDWLRLNQVNTAWEQTPGISLSIMLHQLCFLDRCVALTNKGPLANYWFVKTWCCCEFLLFFFFFPVVCGWWSSLQMKLWIRALTARGATEQKGAAAAAFSLHLEGCSSNTWDWNIKPLHAYREVIFSVGF